ncbi:MAG: ATP-grasp domain-containing protein, partial [Rhizonema sp. PD38]|nr:ATP-grasp domain-containing protein [Rhizonema sp. PD38]
MAGIKVLNNAAALSTGQNKFVASALMSKLGIPHIPTWLVGSPQQLELAIAALQFPLVIKPVSGAKGQGVMLVEDAVALQEAAQPYFSANLPVYLQQRIRKPDRDIRVRVINYKANFAFYRYVAEGKFISNLCQGGKFSPAEIDDALRELSERCARAFQAPVAGIDIC